MTNDLSKIHNAASRNPYQDLWLISLQNGATVRYQSIHSPSWRCIIFYFL